MFQVHHPACQAFNLAAGSLNSSTCGCNAQAQAQAEAHANAAALASRHAARHPALYHLYSPYMLTEFNNLWRNIQQKKTTFSI